jgi:hypothetical protein
MLKCNTMNLKLRSFKLLKVKITHHFVVDPKLDVTLEKGKNPFPIMGATADNDDSAPLLSTTKKPYKQLIHTNSISFFDFRIYVLGRQCTILAKRHRFVELAKKAAWFVPTFGKTLKQHEVCQSVLCCHFILKNCIHIWTDIERTWRVFRRIMDLLLRFKHCRPLRTMDSQGRYGSSLAKCSEWRERRTN